MQSEPCVLLAALWPCGGAQAGVAVMRARREGKGGLELLDEMEKAEAAYELQVGWRVILV